MQPFASASSSSAAPPRRAPIADRPGCRSWSRPRWPALRRCSRRLPPPQNEAEARADRQVGMRLTEEEQAMLAGEQGRVRQWAVRHQIAVGDFFDAPDFVPVGQAHVMADTESLGEAGVAWLEGLAAAPQTDRCVRIPTITDPRGLDFASY